MIRQVTFKELCEDAKASAGAGKLPRVRVIGWEDYCEQTMQSDEVAFPAPMTEAQQIAYWENIVALACINDRGEYLVVLADAGVESA